jgi:tetratricopeptide (TPR) repeat protein
MGFATRKLGHYRRALAHYQQALDLNPYHRGALEYLGETYLEMGCITQAQEVLARLEAACKRITDDSARDRWQAGCSEWQDLHAALTTARPPATLGCTLE